MIVSASTDPLRAYSPMDAESFVYRKDEDDKKWKAVPNGLPEPSGTTIMTFASNRLQESFMASITMAYSYRLIQVNHGENLTLHVQENIYYKLLGHSQLTRSSIEQALQWNIAIIPS